MGGKKKQTIGYKYYLGMHLILSLGPIDKLLKIYADKKLAWEGPSSGGAIIISSDELFGGEEKEGGISGNFELQMGLPDQTTNSYLASKLSPELVPAFRGVVSLIAKQAYFGTQSYLKNIAFLAQRIHVRQTGLAQWYDEKAEIKSNPDDTDNRVSVVVSNSSQVKASPDGFDYPYSATVPPGYPIITIIPSADKKSFYAITTFLVLQSVDGINWVTTADLTSVAAGGINSGSLVYWKGYYWLVRSSFGVSRSLDCITWEHQYSNIFALYPSGNNLLAESSSSSKMLYISSPDDYITFNFAGEKPVSIVLKSAVWDGSLLKIAVEKIVTGSDRRCAVYSTVDGNTFTEDSKSYTDIQGGFYSITYGNGTWVAIGYNGEICIKVGSDSWIQTTDDFAYSTASRYLQFFDNKFWLLIYNSSPVSGNFYASLDGTSGSWTEISTGFSAPYRFAGGALIGEGVATGDMNPAHIIRECLTDPDWGMGYQDADIDDVSFQAAADKLYNERFGLSLEWTRQTTIEDFVKEILKHIDGSLFVDRKTGKFKLTLIRDDYDLEDLVTLDKSNIDSITDFVRPTFGELTNSITVQFWDKTLLDKSSVTVQDIALAQMQGTTINTALSYSGITTKELAARVAERDLKTLSTPMVSCTINTDRTASDFEIGQPFKLTWPEFKCNGLVMRATSIAYGDGLKNRVRVTCTQDIYKLPDTAIIIPETPAWVDPSTEPVPATLRKVFEVPYLEAVQRQGQTVVDAVILADPSSGYAGAAAGRPSQASINANLNTNSGAGFSIVDNFDFCPTAKIALASDRVQTAFILSEMIDIEAVNSGDWVQIDDELMSVVSIVGTTLTVKRGVLDTIPALHPINSIAFFWDDYSGADNTQYVEGETVDIKITPITGRGELVLADAPTDSLDIVGRIARPYPPANLTINGFYWPVAIDDYTLILQWVDRNRLTQTGDSLVGWYDSEITKESNITYSLRVLRSSDNAVLYTADDITLSEYTVPFINEDLVKLQLWSVRDGLESFQKVDYEFSIANALLAETGDILLTESGAPIALEGTVFIQYSAMDVIYGSGANVFASTPVIPAGGFLFKSSDSGQTYAQILNTGSDIRVTFANSGVEHYFATLSDNTYVSVGFNALSDTAALRYVIAKQVVGDLDTLPLTPPVVSGSDVSMDAYANGYPRTATDYVRTVALGSDGTNFYLIGQYPDPSKPQGFRLFKAGASFVLTDLGAIGQDAADPNMLASSSPASWNNLFSPNMQLEKFGANWILRGVKSAYWINDIEDLNVWRWSNLQLNESTRTNPALNLQKIISASGLLFAFDGATNMAAVSKSSDDGVTWTTVYPSAIRDGILRFPVSFSSKAIIQGVGNNTSPQTGVIATPFASWTLQDTTGIPTGANIQSLTGLTAGVAGSTDTGYLIYSADGYNFEFAKKE